MKLLDVFKTQYDLNKFVEGSDPKGSGYYSRVYRVSENTVLKVFKADAGYEAFLRYVEANPSDHHLPVIHDIWRGRDEVAVLMEMLEPLPKEWGGSEGRLVTKESLRFCSCPVSWMRIFSRSFDRSLKRIQDYYLETRVMATWDLHPDNIMLRKGVDGEVIPVIIDPWC